MTTDHEFAVVASTTDVQKVFVAIELSKSTWVVAIQPPAVDKVSLFRIAGGKIERLFELFEQARRRAGQPIEICACYEAGYDGFWIYRALTARGVACTVLDSASIQVSRRARRGHCHVWTSLADQGRFLALRGSWVRSCLRPSFAENRIRWP